jgi:anti-sigma factor RsiW
MGAHSEGMLRDGSLEHGRARASAATAIDFPLTDEESVALSAHLETCPACRGFATALRNDAEALAALVQLDAPVTVRERIMREVTRRRSPTGGILGLALAALLVAALVEVVLGVEGAAVTPHPSFGPGPGAPIVSLHAAGGGSGAPAWSPAAPPEGSSVP